MTEQSEDGVFADIGADLTVYEATALCERFSTELADTEALTVDLSQVTTVDGAGLQLLASFLLAARQRQKPVQINGISEELAKALRLFGLINLTQSEEPTR